MNFLKDATRSLIRTVKATFTFTGRSRIVDLVYYWIASMVVGALVGLPLDLLRWDLQWFADQAARIVLTLPIFALFARRLHDQGISGWWAFLLLPFPPINLYQSYRAVFAVRNPSWLHEPNPLAPWTPWLLVIMVGILILLLRPGQRGPNRFGPDPREPARV
ncbi:MAG: DUF805 domain-containing protein [Brevundimonas sp.]